MLSEHHNDLFVDLVSNLIYKVELFGLYFASLDIRQDSGIHEEILEYIAEHSNVLPENYDSLDDEQKIDILSKIEKSADADGFEDEMVKDTLKTIRAIKTIQKSKRRGRLRAVHYQPL